MKKPFHPGRPGTRPRLVEADKILSPADFKLLCYYWTCRAQKITMRRGPRVRLAKRNALIIRTLGETGLRASELCRLEFRDLRLDDRNPSILVRRGKWRKDGQADSVFISKEFASELEEILPKGLELTPGEATWNRRIFLDSNGKPIDRRDVLHAVKQAVSACGLNPKFSAHTLRHFAISRWCERPGATPQAVAKQARLRSLDVALRYFHASPEKQADLVR